MGDAPMAAIVPTSCELARQIDPFVAREAGGFHVVVHGARQPLGAGFGLRVSIPRHGHGARVFALANRPRREQLVGLGDRRIHAALRCGCGIDRVAQRARASGESVLLFQFLFEHLRRGARRPFLRGPDAEQRGDARLRLIGRSARARGLGEALVTLGLLVDGGASLFGAGRDLRKGRIASLTDFGKRALDFGRAVDADADGDASVGQCHLR